MAGNEALLRMQLKKALGWDDDFLQDIFGSITSATSMSDVEDVITVCKASKISACTLEHDRMRHG